MELPEVDVVHTKAVERAVQLFTGALGSALTGLGPEEELVRAALQPGGDPQLGLAVAGSDVDVVDPVREQNLERPVGLFLSDPG